MQEYSIDATEKKLGRLASEVATLLMGKNRTDFARHMVAPVKVTVVNASKLDITQKQLKTKEYKRFTGYPSGQKIEVLSKVVSEKGYGEALRRAVYGMLPGNKLRARMMKRLIIND